MYEKPYTYVEVYDDGSIGITFYVDGQREDVHYFASWDMFLASYELGDYPVHVNLDVYSETGKSINRWGKIVGPGLADYLKGKE